MEWMPHSALSELQLSTESMRDLGYRVIDLIVQHFSELPQKPAMRVSPHSLLERQLREPIPQKGADAEGVLATVTDQIFSSIGHLNHPRFFAFIPTPSNFVSVMADALASAYTPFVGTWISGSGAGEVELIVIDWLRQLFGLPETGGGLFVSGGSIANLTALAAARHVNRDGDSRTHVFYCSDQTHSSIDRAIRILGYEPWQLRKIPCDPDLRLDLEALRRTVDRDRADRLRPAAVIANAGTTNTGAVDPLTEVAAFCREGRMWMHVDAAYGGGAMFSERRRTILDGIPEADSITLDPHKWLFQPYAMGCLLVRNRRVLGECFQVHPEYLQDTRTGEINFCDYGPELTRPFRALKLWMSLKVFGAAAFGRAVDHGFEMAEAAERILRESDCWEITSPAGMAIVSFRHRHLTDEQNRRIAQMAAKDGCCFCSTTVLGGRTVIRMCTIHPATTDDDLRRSIRCLEQAAGSLS